MSKIPFFKFFTKTKFSVSNVNKYYVGVNPQSTFNCVGRIEKRLIKDSPCHPELAAPLVADEKEAYKGGCSQSISGSSHRQKCSAICTQKINVGVKPQPTLISVSPRRRSIVMQGLRPHSLRKVAFTLAEVLITLGIIGVVAAMTLPVLINNYQKNVTVTRLKKFYTTFSQAHLRAEEANGPFESWTLTDDSSTRDDKEAVFEKYYKPYINVSRCDSSCAPDFFKALNLTDSRLVYQLSDGSLFMFEPSQFTNAANPNIEQWIYIIVDINGNTNPNISGRDIFHLDIYPKYGLVMLGRFGEETDTLRLKPSTRNELINGVGINSGNSTAYCKDNCGDNTYCKHSCGALIQMDGWQIKDDYPW